MCVEFYPSVEIYGNKNPAVFDPHLWYGRALLELCRLQEDVIDGAGKTASEPVAEGSKQEELDKNADKDVPGMTFIRK